MEFIAPKNFKNGRKIFNCFKIGDLVLTATLTVISFMMVIFYAILATKPNFIIVILLFFPAIIGYLLTIPFGTYHNIKTFFKVFNIFLKTNKKYFWQGIIKDEKKYEK